MAFQWLKDLWDSTQWNTKTMAWNLAVLSVGATAGAAYVNERNMADLKAMKAASQDRGAAGGQQALNIIASAHEDFRDKLRPELRGVQADAEQRRKARTKEINDALAANELTSAQGDDRLAQVQSLYASHRQAALDAYRRSFNHELLQLQTIRWSPQQRPLVDERIAELETTLDKIDALRKDSKKFDEVLAVKGQEPDPQRHVSGFAQLMEFSAAPGDTVAVHPGPGATFSAVGDTVSHKLAAARIEPADTVATKKAPLLALNQGAPGATAEASPIDQPLGD